MLLMRGNKVYCNTHSRCYCTYCHSLHMWQQVSLATPAVLQQLLLQHPLWLFILWLATLHGVATTLDCVVIGENLLQHQNEPWCKLQTTVTVATPPNTFLCFKFVYCNTFWPIATLLGSCIRGKTLQCFSSNIPRTQQQKIELTEVRTRRPL